MTVYNKSGSWVSLPTKSRWKTPEAFFPVVVDNFFNDPDALVNYGKILPKRHGDWPGKRSNPLHEIDEELQVNIILKILSCYYDLDYIEISWNSSVMYFQEIPRFSENKNDIRNKGWIHQDQAGPGNFQLAGLVYLTPNIDPDSGTSLYGMKSTASNKNISQSSKFTLFKTGSFDREEYTMTYMKHEENFMEKVKFQNIFNRLITYDTNEWHRANSYYNDDGENARLTLVFFVGGLSVHPLKRMNNSEYETLIKLRIENENKT